MQPHQLFFSCQACAVYDTLHDMPPSNLGKISRNTKEALKEAREFARQIVDNPEYRTRLLERALRGTLPAAVELRLLEYRYGRPADQVAMTHVPQPNESEPLEELSDEQLAARAEALAKNLRGARKFAVVAGTDTVQ